MHVATDIIAGPFKYSPKGRLVLSRYFADGSVAIQIVDPETGEPLLTATVLPHTASPAEGEFFIKAWSENEGCDTALERAGLIEPTGKFAPCGYELAACYRAAGELDKWLERLPSKTDFENALAEPAPPH